MRFNKGLRICFAPDGAETGSGGLTDSISNDILDLFNSEFGEGSAEIAQTESEPASSEPTTPEEPAPQAEPASESTEEETPASQEVEKPTQAPAVDQTQALADALATIKALQAQVAESKQSATPAQAAPEKDPVFEEDPSKFYKYTIPQALYNALFSSESTPEERVNALQGFAQGISTHVHKQIIQSLGTWTKENFNAVPRVVDYLINQRNQAQATRTSIKDQFYKEFPDLQRPELAPLLKATIQQVQKETKAQTWSPAVQKQVGTRMRALLQSFAAPVQAPVPPKPAPVAAKPTIQVQTKDPNAPENIMNTLADIF